MTNPPMLSVLIVDDEAPARARLRDLLADVADEVPNKVAGEAANGVLALEILAEQQVDVLLLDIRMPKMDGIELARHLAQLEKPPAIIFVTAYTTVVQAATNYSVDVVLAFILMVAGVIGAQYGVRVGQKLRGEQLRALLALLVLAVALRLAVSLVVRPEDLFSVAVGGLGY